MATLKSQVDNTLQVVVKIVGYVNGTINPNIKSYEGELKEMSKEFADLKPGSHAYRQLGKAYGEKKNDLSEEMGRRKGALNACHELVKVLGKTLELVDNVWVIK
jgi:hydrogenase maturation factor HypE